jgi:GNAT superfamily N-acetyltransferase
MSDVAIVPPEEGTTPATLATGSTSSTYEPCPYDAAAAVETFSFATDGGVNKTIRICPYKGEEQIQQIIALVAPQLSEPYSIFTYRFFLSGWPQLCFLAHDGDRLIGAIVSKDEMRKDRSTGADRKRGYVAMLVVDPAYRKAKIGMRLAALCVKKMMETCDEVSGLISNGAFLLGVLLGRTITRAHLLVPSRWYLKPKSRIHRPYPSTSR